MIGANTEAFIQSFVSLLTAKTTSIDCNANNKTVRTWKGKFVCQINTGINMCLYEDVCLIFVGKIVLKWKQKYDF